MGGNSKFRRPSHGMGGRLEHRRPPLLLFLLHALLACTRCPCTRPLQASRLGRSPVRFGGCFVLLPALLACPMWGSGWAPPA
eukprot:5597710-Alexandrium_andersonii.AAC.1